MSLEKYKPEEIGDFKCPKCKTPSEILDEGQIWVYAWCRECKNYFDVGIKREVKL